MTDHGNWTEEIRQPEPLPMTIASPEDRLVERMSDGPPIRRIFLIGTLALLMLAPVASEFAQSLNANRMARIERTAAESRDVNLLANRVAGQYAQGLSLLQSTARDVETLPASQTEIANKVEELQTRANEAIGFFSAAEAGSAALLASTPPAMTPRMRQDIFIDGRDDLIAFYSGVGDRVRNAYASAAGQPVQGKTDMIKPLDAIAARESRLRAWLADFQDSERRRLSHIQDAGK